MKIRGGTWEKGGSEGEEGKKKGTERRIGGGRECNRKLLSELPMAYSQSVQTLKNSRQRAGREGRCQEGGREAQNEEGGAHLRFVVKGGLLHEKGRARA